MCYGGDKRIYDTQLKELKLTYFFIVYENPIFRMSLEIFILYCTFYWYYTRRRPLPLRTSTLKIHRPKLYGLDPPKIKWIAPP